MNIHWKNWCWSWSSILWSPDVKSWLTGKDPDAVKDRRQEEKGMTEDEMVGWQHWLNEHEFEQALGDDGQGSLACGSPWSHKELDMNEWLNNDKLSQNENEELRELLGFPGGTSDKECSGKCTFDPWVRKIPWRREWHLISVLLLGES